ncbi:hypothetical protein Acal01_00160 [Acinetobacter calcoaceticus]|jgi:hypothetical protein|uniref:hypothetical protein n=1 Tax=Acinetobacter TaxID=469 RepID=UPI0001BB50F6|nr:MULTISPECIES: hypothetical protein [Acinetobacter]EEY78173.1 hypothetical protein HMPREF0012_01042 [Acinetobacter calcoaceticus RUH2202]ENU09258.1 hypothetical protein F997_02707 [Acinetobacter calcoaceticus NIPH 13]ENV93184.1 hypothetical protein F937_02583 [Acinetobacter calcoaceticus ANC 3680]KJH64430.1 hypothetical protein UF12_05655 [Acinetobacter calcoaceticus]MBP2603273.1 hypothetical protein [Acinetobacter calcoaceticus]
MLKSIIVLGTGIAIGMCVYKKKQKNSKSFNTDSDTDSVISKDSAKNQDDGQLDNAVKV